MRGDLRIWVAFGLICIIQLGLCETLFTFSNDDPFIFFRYADNLIAGHGPVMNPGERVEGFTSPLQLFLSVLIRRTPLDPLLAAKALGVLWALGTIGVVFAVGRSVRPRSSGWNLAAPALTAANVWCALQAVNGLETSLAGFLLAVTAWLLVREERAPGGEDAGEGPAREPPRWTRWGLSGAALGLASLARPEVPLLGAAIAAALAVLVPGTLRAERRRIWLARLGLFAAVTAPYLASRLAYYHQLLPNTYFAKRLPVTLALRLGVAYLVPILAVNLGLALVVCLPAAIRGGSRSGRVVAAIAAGALAGAILFVLLTGGDWMEGYRFLVPVLPLCFLGVQEGLAALGRATRPAIVVAALGALAVLNLAHDLSAVRMNGAARPWHSVGWARRYRDLLGRGPLALTFEASDSLGRIAPPGSLVAIGEAGIIPFEHPSLRFVDEHGLTDAVVSRMDAPRTRIGPQADYAAPGSPVVMRILALEPSVILRSTNRWTWERTHSILGDRYDLAWSGTRGRWGEPDVGYLLWKRRR